MYWKRIIFILQLIIRPTAASKSFSKNYLDKHLETS